MNYATLWKRVTRPSIPLWVRLGVPVCFIVAALIGLISFLNFYNYQKTYRQLNVSRILVVARDLRETIEAGLNVGLAPKSNTELQTALTLAKNTTPGLRFAAVIDARTHARLAEIGEIDPVQDWGSQLSRAGDTPFWQGEDNSSYQIGLLFRNNFSVVEGSVIVGYDKRAIDQAMATMRSAMLFDWIKTSAIFAALALFGVWWLTRRLESELKLAEDALNQAFEAKPVMSFQAPLLGPDIESGIPAFIEKSRSAATALRAVTQEAGR